jgi:hypothetical protein
MRRRARLASCRAASGERSTIGAISSKGEDVVEYEREALGRAQRLQHDEQREADGVGQQRLVLRVGSVGAVDERVGHVDAERLLPPPLARAEHVQRHAGDDGRQPGREVLDLPRIRAVEPEPRLLDGVVRLAQGAEHPIGHGPQVRALLLESLRQPVALVRSGHVPPSRRVIEVDPRNHADVTKGETMRVLVVGASGLVRAARSACGSFLS